jgi:hypothetical protein
LARPPARVKPDIALGTKCTLRGEETIVIGFLERSVTSEGVRYPWREYLLYAAKIGFRWIVESSGHYSYVRAVSAGEVSTWRDHAGYAADTFRAFQSGVARVDHVEGEFYWRVAIGEIVTSTDFVAPPLILSRETSGTEINWSLGSYVARDDLARALGVDVVTLPSPSGVAANQPWPHVSLDWLAVGLVLFAALVFGVQIARARASPLVEQRFDVPAQTAAQEGTIVFTPPFAVEGKRNLEVAITMPVDNSWGYVRGDFVSEASGFVQTFELPVEYYHGYEDGESWSEGSPMATLVHTALPAGTYVLRLDVQREKWALDTTATVRVREGVTRPIWLGLVLLLVVSWPVVMRFARASFERRRWAESDFAEGDDE